MRIAITGGSGRIGQAAIELALAQGHTVVSIDRTPPAPDTVPPNTSFVEADITQYAAVERALHGCEALMHLAAIPSPWGYPDYEIHNNNVVGSYTVLSASATLGIQRVCLASSINAIGGAFSRAPRYDYLPLDEQHPSYAEDAYSVSKWIGEQQADSFARRYPTMRLASLRFHMAVPDRAKAAQAEKRLGDVLPKQLWGYVRFDSAARACLLALTASFTGHEVFYIVAPDTMVETPSLELKQRFFSDVPAHGDLSGHRGFFNCTKAERLLGWKHDLV